MSVTQNLQRLRLLLEGITAGDYLAWVADPEPAALGIALRSIEVSAEPLGDTVEVTLAWFVPAPPAPQAVQAAGLPIAYVARVEELSAGARLRLIASV